VRSGSIRRVERQRTEGSLKAEGNTGWFRPGNTMRCCCSEAFAPPWIRSLGPL